MMDLVIAHRIVFYAVRAVGGFVHPDIDGTLERFGVISSHQQLAFREYVLSEVLNEGFRISKGDIPAKGDTTLREIIEALHAYSLPGDPTTGDDDV